MGNNKTATKEIPDQYYAGLKIYGHIVPRYDKTGEPIPFKVGNDYNIISPSNKEPLFARCTQDCPYHLKLNNQ